MILLIDGRSGSGKTELARAIGAPQLVRLDDLYPGWDGLERGSAAVAALLATGRWQRWDWASGEPAEWHEVDLALPLVVEGCGALSRANRAVADHGVWVTLDAATRKARALAREPDYAPHWDAWAAQEDTFIAREDPASLADEIVDGTDVVDAAARWRAVLAG